MSKINKAVIPVAGYATRLFPASEAISKVMFPLGTVPTLVFLLQECKSAGIEELYFVISKNQKDIKKFFKIMTNQRPITNSVQYTKDWDNIVRLLKYFKKIKFIVQKNPNGLGDAILTARKALGKSDFAVLLGDIPCLDQKASILSKLIKLYTKQNGESNIVALKKIKKSETKKYGIAFANEDLQIFDVIEKPMQDVNSTLAILGRYVFKNKILECLYKIKKYSYKEEELQLTSAIEKLINIDNNVQGILIENNVEDIGTEEGYIKAFINYVNERNKNNAN